MNANYFRLLYDYNYWARDRILAAADAMTEEEYQRPNGFTYNGIYAILAHWLAAENIWVSRFRREDASLLPEAEIATLPALQARWKVEEARTREFLASLTDEDVQADLVVRRRSGEVATPMWLLLGHLVNHSTQHRSEAAEALTMIGRSPGALDLTTYYWELR